MKKHLIALAMTILSAGAISVSATVESDRLTDVLAASVEQGISVGSVKVKSVTINSKARKITVKCNEPTSYLPFTQAYVTKLKKDMLAAMGSAYKNYKVVILADGKDVEDLIIGNGRKFGRPSEEVPFVSYPDKYWGVEPVKGLLGRNIAVWQSHGYYFEKKLNRWEWQRARVMQTVEDLFTQSFVMPFVMPMLENAGAYVMSPRERDTNLTEIIIDNDGGLATGEYVENGDWSSTENPGFAHLYAAYNDREGSSNPFTLGTTRLAHANTDAVANWNAEIPETGSYAVYVSYQTEKHSTESAKYVINAADMPHEVIVNQKMGGGTWIYLGHYQLNKGKSNEPLVQLFATGKKHEVVTADAVKIGGGYGIIERPAKTVNDLGEEKVEYISSKYPKFTEAARY